MIKNLSTNGTNGKGVSLEEKLEEGHRAPLIVVLGAPTFMSAWVLLLDDKEPIHEGHEWTRRIA